MQRPWLASLLAVFLFLTISKSSSSSPKPTTTSLVSSKPSHTRITGFGSHTITKSIFAKEITSPHSSSTLSVHQPKNDSSCLYFQSKNNKNATTTTCLSTNENGDLIVTETNIVDDDVDEWIPIDGLYGIYNVPSGRVVVLITSSHEVYTCHSSLGQIRRVDSMELLHLPSNTFSLKLRQIKEEMRQLKLLRQALRQHEFYYIHHDSSKQQQYKMDMTQTMQRHFLQQRQSSSSLSWWKRTSPGALDSRFFWNEPAVQPLLHKKDTGLSQLLPHVLVVTAAFVGVQTNMTLNNNNNNNNTTYDQILISRKSRFRAGTRFTKRGADGTGAVANYAETEQLLVCHLPNATCCCLSSHVQTRGSIPLRWSSPTDVKTYRPRVRIGIDPLAQARALRSHLMEQWSLYYCTNTPKSKHPQLVFVNLIDKHGDQGRLGRAFGAVLDAVLDVYKAQTAKPNISKLTKHQHAWFVAPHMVRHVWFDFHAECRGGRWDRLKNLLKDVSATLDEQSYFCAVLPSNQTDKWEIKKLQRGVIRTNCMDCLDRTNVVQSIFGRYMLFRQLQELPTTIATRKRNLPLEYASKFRQNSMSLPWTPGEVAHRLLWADNADAISRLYAGTPALKGDFTRTGKRTKRGALDDGMNSLQRYYLNNFLDADRQEGMDLLVGYADFAIVDDDDDVVVGGDNMNEEETGLERPISIQEAARATMLGLPTGSAGEDYTDEMHYARIKVKKPTGVGPGRRPLGLRWLPGDLQSHMRSHAASLVDQSMLRSNKMDYGFSTSSALEAIDRRAASDQPWWVTVDSSDDEQVESKENLGTRSANAGHLIGGLVASFQMPIATAAAVVCLMVPSVWPKPQSPDRNKKS